MRNTITRTLKTSTVHGHIVNIVDDQPTLQNLDPVVVMGVASKSDAKKALQKKYGKDVDVVVGKIDTTETLYEISLEDFMKYAKPVEKKPENEEKKEVI